MPTYLDQIEVTPDMHNKFIIFDNECVITGSFNITFKQWPNNWESGLAFSTNAVCRIFENIFQSTRGGVIQKYSIDPYSPFNILFTFGRHTFEGINFRPHRAIIRQIQRATSSIHACLFIIGEMEDEGNNIINALILRKKKVYVNLILNGHIVREGPNDKPFAMKDELKRPMISSVKRLINSGVKVNLAYGRNDDHIPYCPIHSKYCIIDDRIVIDGSFNWYKTSVVSHDIVVIINDYNVARKYKDEFNFTLSSLRMFK